MPIVTDDILRVTATFDMPGNTIAQNVFYLRYDGEETLSYADCVADCTGWLDDMYDIIDAVIADTVSLSLVELSLLVPTTPPSFVGVAEAIGSFAGIAVEQALPNGVAFVLRFASAFSHHQVRKFIAGISEAHVDEDQWVASVIAGGILWIADWLFGPDVVDHPYTTGTWRRSDDTFEPAASSGVVSAVPGYQRRRKPGVGV